MHQSQLTKLRKSFFKCPEISVFVAHIFLSNEFNFGRPGKNTPVTYFLDFDQGI